MPPGTARRRKLPRRSRQRCAKVGQAVDCQPAKNVQFPGWVRRGRARCAARYVPLAQGRQELPLAAPAGPHGRPVAVFAMGPLKDEAKDWQDVRAQLDKELLKFPWLAPVAAEVFGGKHDPAKLTFPHNLIPALKQMPATDIRDWAAIRAWAVGLRPSSRQNTNRPRDVAIGSPGGAHGSCSQIRHPRGSLHSDAGHLASG